MIKENMAPLLTEMGTTTDQDEMIEKRMTADIDEVAKKWTVTALPKAEKWMSITVTRVVDRHLMSMLLIVISIKVTIRKKTSTENHTDTQIRINKVELGNRLILSVKKIETQETLPTERALMFSTINCLRLSSWNNNQLIRLIYKVKGETSLRNSRRRLSKKLEP